VRCRFCLGRRPVVAGGTVRRDPGMVHLGADERHRTFVAGLTRLRRGDVRCGFTLGLHAIVTGRTAARNPRMAKRRGLPRCRLVTSFARRGRRHVAHWLGGRQGAVVAGRAAGSDACMVHLRASKRHGAKMAGFAR
jgi:hypothetical protein